MTIDEAIKFCHEKSENIKLKAEPQVFIDIAEWLEELKAIKGNEIPIIHGKEELELHDKEIRNKAIYEYMNLLCDHCMQQKNECHILECPFCTDGCDIVNIAQQLTQQLKEGAVDGNSTTDN
jgi:hypothetical protein